MQCLSLRFSWFLCCVLLPHPESWHYEYAQSRSTIDEPVVRSCVISRVIGLGMTV